MGGPFTTSDLLRTFEAALLFSIVLLLPGYVTAWSLDCFGFRRRLLIPRVAIAVPLSIAICPIITDLLGRVFPPAVWFFYAACAATFLFLVFLERGALLCPASLRVCVAGRFGFLGLLTCWFIVAILTLVDLQIGQRLYFPTVSYDYSLRVAFTSAITRTGLPPHNPCFFPGRFYPLRYHYLWLTLSSIVQQLSGGSISARQAVLAATPWCGLGLLAIMTLYLRFFVSQPKSSINRRAWLGVGLLAVTGLDLLPVLLLEFKGSKLLPTIEWWNDDQVTSWLASVMWVPHHVAALISCLVGFLLIWDSDHLPTIRRRVAVIAISALAFASAVGMSIYVTLVFAVFLLIWSCVAFLRHRLRFAVMICLSGFLALAVSVPFLRELFDQHQIGSAGMLHGSHGSLLPIEFGVRRLKLLGVFVHFDKSWKENIANLIALPLNYFLEFGFFFLVGVIQCRRMWRNRRRLRDDQLCAATMLVTSFVICTFFRSTAIASNDLGWRGFLIAQFVLLLWAAEMLDGGLRFTRSWLVRSVAAVALVLGIAASGYELIKIRFYPLMQDATHVRLYEWLSPDRHLGERSLALRQAYEDLNRRSASDIVFQHNPHTELQDLFHGLYAEHQVAAETTSCEAHFGGDAQLCKARIDEIERFFDDSRPFRGDSLDHACAALSIGMLVVKDTDRVWRDRDSWIWHHSPILASPYVRAFDCGVQHRALPVGDRYSAGLVTVRSSFN